MNDNYPTISRHFAQIESKSWQTITLHDTLAPQGCESYALAKYKRLAREAGYNTNF